jgi:serine/threonine-protein kinase
VGAREQLERAVAIGSAYEAFANLATLEFYEGNFNAAARLYENALDIDDRDNMVWLGLAEASKFGSGSPESVRDAYQQAADRVSRRLEADPDNVGLLIDLAGLQLQIDQRTDALSIIERLPLDEITAPDMMYSLAEIFEVLGDRDEALVWIQRAIDAGFPLHVIEDYAAFDELRSDPRYRILAETHAAQLSTGTTKLKKEGEN